MSEAARFIVRAELRRRYRSYLAVAVVVLISASVAMTALAGARRTASAFDRYLDASDASALAINVNELDGPTAQRLRDLPGVESVQTYAGALFIPVDPETEELLVPPTIFEGIVSVDGRFLDQDRAAVVAGRLPDPEAADEVLINRSLASATGFEVGDEITLALLDPSSFEFIGTTPVTVVGIGVTAEDVAVADIDALQRMITTPAFLAAHPELLGSGEFSFTYWWSGLRLADGVSVASVEQAWESSQPPADDGQTTNVRYRRTDTIRDSVQRATRPQVVALGAFGVLAAVVALVLTALAVRRTVRAGATDAGVLRAIGADPATATVGPTVASSLAVVVGALGAAVLAAVLSPLAPIGPARAVEPHDGVVVDLAPLGLGVLVVSLAGVGVAVFVARRVRSGAGATDTVTPALPLPLVLGVGTQFALGRRSAAARTAVVGAVLATIAVVATLAFGQSLDHLEHTPRLFGDDFDTALQIGSGYSQFDGQAFASYLSDQHPDLATAWATMSYDIVGVEGVPVPVLGLDPGEGSVGPTVGSGRAPTAATDIVLGAETLAALGVEVGDEVDVEGSTFHVVGTAVLPSLGQATGDHSGLGIGAWMTGDALRALRGGAATDELGASAVLLRLAPGADIDAVAAAMEQEPLAWGVFPEDAEEGAEGLVQVVQPPRPAELVGTTGSGSASVALSASLAVGAVVALAFALAASVRTRRRDLAVLKSLGCTRGQLIGMIETQGAVTMLVGALVGVPVGLLLGTLLWRLFADDLGVVVESVAPLRLVVLAGVAATLAAVVVAALPARAAARAPASLALRAE